MEMDSVHQGIVCDQCQVQRIEGPRYKCTQCPDFDLCQACYDSGQHNTSHSFWQMDRPDSVPVAATPLHVPDCTYVTPIPKVVSPPTPRVENVLPTPDVVFVRAELVSFTVGQQVRISGLVNRSELNGHCGVIMRCLDDDRYLVKMPDQAKNTVFKVGNLEAIDRSPFPIGSLVETKGLMRF